MSAVPYGNIYSQFGINPIAPAIAAPSPMQQMGLGYGSPMPAAAPTGPDYSGIMSGWGGAPAGPDPMAAAAPAVDPMTGQPAPPQGFMAKAGNWLSNGQNLATVFQGISALTGAYLGFQQLRLAKENMALQKESYRTNMANSTQSYNTSLEDRIRGRTADYAGKENDVQDYLNANRLKTKAP